MSPQIIYWERIKLPSSWHSF